jgi:hypothetical protein
MLNGGDVITVAGQGLAVGKMADSFDGDFLKHLLALCFAIYAIGEMGQQSIISDPVDVAARTNIVHRAN